MWYINGDQMIDGTAVWMWLDKNHMARECSTVAILAQSRCCCF